MDKKPVVSPKDICQIINICAKTNIKKIEFYGVKMEFAQVDQREQAPETAQTRVDKKAQEEIEKEVSDREKEVALEAYEENLRLTDPFAYEQSMLLGGGEQVDGGSP